MIMLLTFQKKYTQIEIEDKISYIVKNSIEYW